jgi:hypothetical protein
MKIISQKKKILHREKEKENINVCKRFTYCIARGQRERESEKLYTKKSNNDDDDDDDDDFNDC